MSRVWYGSLNNRLEENKQFCETIEVGTGMTEYSYSDRHAYEVIEVTDQKHVKVREYDHKAAGECCESYENITIDENGCQNYCPINPEDFEEETTMAKLGRRNEHENLQNC